MQSALGFLYPHQCLSCGAFVERHGALCGDCWRDVPFVTGLACDLCGVPLPGEDEGAVACTQCMEIARPWAHGRAALIYRDAARRLVLALKHGDRLDIVGPAAGWMARAGADILEERPLLVPVPAHRFRLLKRRYNQAALLAKAIAKTRGLSCLPDSLIRWRRTPVLDGLSQEERFRTLDEAIRPHPRRGAALKGRSVCLIDDVMTSGATLTAAAEAAHAAGATEVSVLVLARVAQEP